MVPYSCDVGYGMEVDWRAGGLLEPEADVDVDDTADEDEAEGTVDELENDDASGVAVDGDPPEGEEGRVACVPTPGRGGVIIPNDLLGDARHRRSISR